MPCLNSLQSIYNFQVIRYHIVWNGPHKYQYSWKYNLSCLLKGDMFAFINISTFSSKEYCLLRKQTTPTDRKGPFISIAIPSHTCTPMMKMMISMMIWWSGSYWWSESWWYPTTGQTLGVCAPAGHPKAAWARQVPPHPSDLPPGPQPYGENAFNFNISYFQTRFYIFCPRVISSQRPCRLGRVEKA